MKRIKTKSIFGALCLFFAISLFSVFCSISFNTISVSAYSAAISTSDSVTLDATINGTGTSIKAESINIQTDCRAGYNLNIATPNGSNLYLNGNNSENASFTAVDGTSALSSSNNTNKWGYTLASNPTSSTVFLPLSANTSVLKTPAQTASPNSNINDTFNINYGVHTDETITPGAYRMGNNGTIVYYLTMDESCMTVNIAYDGNNADAGTMGAAGTGVIHTGVKDGDTVNLIASNFSRTGYGFAGWSTDQNAGAKLIDNDNTNNPIVYGPQETVTLPNGFINNDTDNDGIVKLYAVWIPSRGNLQGWVGCNSLDTATYDSTTGALDLTKNSVTALTDQRDNDTYAVARLVDGQCWMIENLRLDNDAVHNSDGALAQGYGGQFVGLADSEIGKNFAYLPSSFPNNSLYSNDGSNNTINIGTDNPAYRMPRYNSINTNSRAVNPTSNSFPDDNTTGGVYSYGNYYTWPAAAASTDEIIFDSQSTLETSLCPAGWHLPTGGGAYAANSSSEINKTGSPATYSEFYNLGYKIMNEVKTAYEDTSNGVQSYYSDNTINMAGDTAAKAFRKYPNNFVYSGGAYFSAISNRGKYGSYWSSTTSSYSANAFNLSVGPVNVYPATYTGYRYSGRSVRCVAPSNLYAVHFDPNTSDAITGVMSNQSIAENVATSLKANAFQRPASSSVAYRFVKWNTKPDGSGVDYINKTPVTNLAAVGQTITLYAQWEQFTPMTVNFMSNGLNFRDESSLNTVYYDNSACSMQTITKYSHTSNIRNDGTQIGNAEYDADLASKDVVTIPGANKLHVTITYGIEEEYDMLYVFQGEYTGPVTADMSAGQLKTYTGGDNTTTTIELDIPGDTATFAFYSDEDVQYWGYYASVIGIDSNNNEIIGTICSRAIANGEYKKPIINNHQEFLGWSESQSATTADYTTAKDVLNNLSGDNGETKTLYAVWNWFYDISYDINTSDTNALGTMGSQSHIVEGDDVTLLASNFSRTGYGFAGWSLDPNAAINSSAKIYGPQETVVAPAYPGANGLKFYAVWVPSAGSIQNSSVAISTCNNLATAPIDGSANINSVSALTDQRDNQTYAIAKLADGNCWMIENLRLESSAAHNSDGTLAQAYGSSATYGNFVGLADPESRNFSSVNPPVANSLYSPSASGEKIIIGTANDSPYRMPRYNNTNTSARMTNPTQNTGSMYSYGNYYTWAAAMANTNYFGSDSNTGNSATLSEAANTSICPAGWKLPYGRTRGNGVKSGGFSYLDKALGGTGSQQNTAEASLRWRKYPNNFLFSGYYDGSSARQRGSYGKYWSSTALGSTYDYQAYSLSLSESAALPGDRLDNKYSAGNIRCLFAGTNNKISYLPNSNEVVDTMDDQTISSSDTEVTLWASNFQYPDYGFAGWSTKPTTTTNGEIDIPDGAVTYGPNETITDPATIAKIKAEGLELYAMWVWYDDVDSMQDWGRFGLCSDLGMGEVTALMDLRDANVYAVAKLADGNCWMIENLRLADKKPNNTSIAIESMQTNNPATNFTQLGASVDPAVTVWCDEGNAACRNQSMLFSGNTTNPISNMNSVDESVAVYSYGNYYNWYSATAGRGLYGAGVNTNTSGDICPKGWHLPTGGGRSNAANSESWQLARAIIGSDPDNSSVDFYSGASSSNAIRRYPNNFVYSGTIYTDSIYERGSVGNYWTSTANGGGSVRFWSLDNSSVFPGSYSDGSDYGFSVRCMVSGS